MLKNVLSLLLSKFYSKQESELVGHQAMPELSQYIDLTSIATANVENTYVAPTDGYFVCATKGGELSGVNVWGTLDAGVPGASGIQGKVFTPCVKGASVHYIIYGTIHLVRFYKTIGGGVQTLKKLILQGGGLCLNSLSSSLRRNSYRTRRSGSVTSLKPSYQGARKSPLSLAPILRTTQRHATELYVSILSLSGQGSALLLISGVSYFTARTKQEFIKCSRFLSQRVKRSTLTSQRIKAPLISSSFRSLALNVVNGGASC